MVTVLPFVAGMMLHHPALIKRAHVYCKSTETQVFFLDEITHLMPIQFTLFHQDNPKHATL